MASNTAKVGGVSAVVLALVTALVVKYEGSRNEAYWDPYGKVWTICEGHTGADVKQGVIYTDAQCKALRDADIAIANASLKRCLTMPMLPQIEAALTDGVYNIDPKLVCGSTLHRKAIANDWPSRK